MLPPTALVPTLPLLDTIVFCKDDKLLILDLFRVVELVVPFVVPLRTIRIADEDVAAAFADEMLEDDGWT
jgi:hypothetical protein